MFKFCQSNITLNQCSRQQRTYFFVENGTIDRNRNSIKVKNSLNGTRALHSVKCVSEPGILGTRRHSCYCYPCISGQNECDNNDYILPWQTRALDMVNKFDDNKHLAAVEIQPVECNDIGDINDIFNELTDQGLLSQGKCSNKKAIFFFFSKGKFTIGSRYYIRSCYLLMVVALWNSIYETINRTIFFPRIFQILHPFLLSFDGCRSMVFYL